MKYCSVEFRYKIGLEIDNIKKRLPEVSNHKTEKNIGVCYSVMINILEKSVGTIKALERNIYKSFNELEIYTICDVLYTFL